MAQESLKAAWETIHEELLKQLEEVNNTKKMLNMLAEKAGIETRFEIENEVKSSGAVRIKTGQFFGKRLATSVTEILKMRGEPMTLDEIVTALQQGSFDIKGSGGEEKVKEGIRKNSTTFILLPGGTHWDIKAKYGVSKGTKRRSDDSTPAEEPAEEVNEEEPLFEEES